MIQDIPMKVGNWQANVNSWLEVIIYHIWLEASNFTNFSRSWSV